MALGYLYIYIFLAIYENWFYALCIHQWYKSFWDMNLSFFPLFWGYKLHLKPINLRKFNLKKKKQFWKNPNHRQVYFLPLRTKWIFVSPKFHKALAYLLHVFFGIFKNSSAPNYLEFRKFLAITLKGTVNTFHKKNQRCPKSTHKLPISPFSKYHKNRTISPFSPIFFFFRNSKNPNHRQVDSTLAHKMNIRFTKISQSPSRPSVKHYLITIFYMYFSEFSKIHQRQTIWNFGNFLLSP